jgi:hypothetical protein
MKYQSKATMIANPDITRRDPNTEQLPDIEQLTDFKQLPNIEQFSGIEFESYQVKLGLVTSYFQS